MGSYQMDEDTKPRNASRWRGCFKMAGMTRSTDQLLRNEKNKGTIPWPISNARISLAIVGGAVIIGIGLAIGLAIGLRSRDSDDDTAAEKTVYKSAHGTYRFAAVATDAEKCSQIGTDVMARQQGNAVDATVAAVICNGVFSTHSAGIGGGAFFVVYNRTTGNATSYNAREMAPAAATQNMYVQDPKQSTLGGKAIGVPGELKGLWVLHEKFGRVPWERLLEPTIRLCKEGSPLSASQHKAAEASMGVIKDDPEFAYLFDNTTGTPRLHPEGTMIYRPKLGTTLQTLATEGASAFYNGSLTQSILDDMKDKGGIITRQDLLNYYVIEEPPATFKLPGKQEVIYSATLPGSGLVLEYMLNILSGYNFSPDSVSTTDKTILTYHRIIEAMKFAFAVRSELGDAKFLNISEVIANMTSTSVGQEKRGRIDDAMTHDTLYYEPHFEITETPGTAHFSVVDGSGNAVAVTSTINLYFGSKVKGSRTGIIFNNEMDDFSTPNTTNSFGVPSSPSNFIEPGKRPLSSMSPTVVVDESSGEVILVVGGAGGTKITTATALIILKTLFFNESLTQAVDDPRFHHQLLPKELALEEADFPQAIVDGLKAKGHQMKELGRSVVNAIGRTPDGKLDAACDFRKGGAPDGF